MPTFLQRISLGVVLPKPLTWYELANPVKGEVNGLGRVFRGTAVASNGIHVAIETSAGDMVFGHAAWFVVDKNESPLDLNNVLSRPAKNLLDGKLNSLIGKYIQ